MSNVSLASPQPAHEPEEDVEEEIPSFLLLRPRFPPPRTSLCKQMSWSPDMSRDEAWARRKGANKSRLRRSKSFMDDDLDELKACVELGFGFVSPEVDPRLSDTFPALEFYCAVVNYKQYNEDFPKLTNNPDETSNGGLSPKSPADSPRHAIFSPGDHPKVVKTRLRQWAQVVAYSVRQSSPA